MKIAILMTYFNRPLLVRKALQSILESDKFFQDWQLYFSDDGSVCPGRPIVEEILKDHLDKVEFIETGMSLNEKLKQGLILGRYANEVMVRTTADAAIVLCDDDQLVPCYLADLSKYFEQHPNVLYCYSKIYLYNPLSKLPPERCASHKYNNYQNPINPAGKIDASQVAWKIDCCRKYGATFRDSSQKNNARVSPDYSFFESLYQTCGECQPTGFYGQMKGIHDHQLVWHQNGNTAALKLYYEDCEQKAGVVF